MPVQIPTSLAGCNELIKSATAAEMIYELAETGSRQAMTEEEWQEYNCFLEAAVHFIVSAIPHYIKPANIGTDMVLAAEHYRRDGIDRRPDPAEQTAAMDADSFEDFEVDDKEEGKWGMC